MPAFHHPSRIESSLHILHQRNHPRINLTHEILVARIEIISIDGVEPEESVVKDGIYMLLHRVFASQSPDCTLHDWRIEESVVIHQIGLDGIAAPYPAVTFYSLNHHFPICQVQCIGTDLPDAVKQRVATFEGSTPCYILHLRLQSNTLHRNVALAFHQRIAHGTAARQQVVIVCSFGNG